jgi:Holliday junction resolvase RusA-like endonuclease
MTISFTVFGTPKALKRHRHTFKDGVHRNYDPSADDKKTFLDQAINYKPDSPLTNPISMDLVFYFPRPKAHYGTGKNANVLKKTAPEYYTIAPDTDNLIKEVSDSLNGIFYKDDSQIFLIVAQKKYTEETPRTTVSINYENLME